LPTPNEIPGPYLEKMYRNAPAKMGYSDEMVPVLLCIVCLYNLICMKLTGLSFFLGHFFYRYYMKFSGSNSDQLKIY